MLIENVLAIVKQDLMIKSTLRDAYLLQLITACCKDLSGRGVYIDDSIDDTFLLADYVTHCYRHRIEDDAALPQHLQLRLNNKKCRRRIYDT